MAAKTAVTQLDWRDLASEPEPHLCDCAYCEMEGELEPTEWPDLVKATRGDALYITDRYMMVLADRAPVPTDYEGVVIDGPANLGDKWREPVSDRPASDLVFRDATHQAMDLTGWRLMHLEHPEDASAITRRRVAVVDERGEQIGWAIAQRHPNEGN